MRYPQVIVLEAVGWVGRQLAELAGESKWLVRTPRGPVEALELARGPRPGVLVVEFDPAADQPEPFALVADAHRLCPEVSVLAVSNAKLPDADRAAWAAVLLDLGARYVLFPPVARTVLEDLVSGLMTAAVRRVVGDPNPAPHRDDIIDLAAEGVGE